jgi:Guanosine polyphosphate pyrophosphohydrolases/synthetases
MRKKGFPVATRMDAPVQAFPALGGNPSALSGAGFAPGSAGPHANATPPKLATRLLSHPCAGYHPERPMPRLVEEGLTRWPSTCTAISSADPASTYITHPLAVTEILADLGMPAPSLAAALLHDTVEDCGYSLDALREDFGDEVALLVDGVTKLDKVTYGEASAAETVRKMVVAMARDIRVLSS